MTSNETGLHITIASAADMPELALDHEIELVKAALLYADRVTLASPKATMVSMVGSLAGLEGADLKDAVLEIVKGFPAAHEIHVLYNDLKKKRHKSKQELLQLRALEQALGAAGADMAERAAKLALRTGLGELVPAMEAELLDVHPLGLDEGSADQIIERLSDVLATVVQPGSSTIPMLDDATGRLLSSMVERGIIEGPRLRPATEAGIAGRFISWVPAFPGAPMEDVLEARVALRDAIVRFRAAIGRIAGEVESSPLDAEFEAAVRELERIHVKPALLELEELARDIGLRRSLGRSALTHGGRRTAEAAVAFAAASYAGIPGLLASVLGVTADITAQVLKDRRELEATKRANKFLFLYEIEDRLAPT